MAARRLIFATFSLTVLSLLPNNLLRGDDASSADAQGSENAKRQFIGVINANSVYVRSGPRDDAYQTMRLDKGAKVTVIGIRFNWLKIVPPEGSFAYVPQVYVTRRGDGKVGRASREIWAKAGSQLNDMKIAQMGKIDEGQDVQILGIKDEYFKIAPPEGSALWVNKQFVDPVQAVAEAPKNALPDSPATGTQGPIAEKVTPRDPADPLPPGSAPTTQPDLAAGPTTRPAELTAQAADQFDALEAKYAAASDKPITEQPLADLQTGYETLLKQDALPTSMQTIAQSRVKVLKLRSEARQEYMAFKDSQEKSNERRKALSAEQEEIEQRLKQNSVIMYAAVGTLRTSSIQHAGSTLYRITDPETGRTVAYIRTANAAPATMLGQFVGVKGTITTDENLNLKVIENPTAVEAVDQTKVNGSVAAQILPPSLLPRSSQASTNNAGE